MNNRDEAVEARDFARERSVEARERSGEARDFARERSVEARERSGEARNSPRARRADVFGATRNRIAVVVPAFNEERLIARTIASIPWFVEHVVVVDDGSADATSRVAQAVGDDRVEVVRHGENRGVGAAIVTGYRTAFASGADVCAVMAGDAQMDPADLWTLVAPVLHGEVHYAKGDRLSYPRVRRLMPLPRWLGNGLLSRLTQLVTGLPIRDSQCGYTALSSRAAQLLPLERLWPRYGYPNDLLGMLSERGLTVREIVVRPIYADEASGLGLRHALFVIPYVLTRVLARRVARSWLAASHDTSRLETLEALEAEAE